MKTRLKGFSPLTLLGIESRCSYVPSYRVIAVLNPWNLLTLPYSISWTIVKDFDLKRFKGNTQKKTTIFYV